MPRIPARLDPAKLGRLLTREEADEHRAYAMTERQLEAAIAAKARAYGWRRYHTHRSDRSPAGFPDDVLVRDGRLLFFELKAQAGRVSDAQEEWLGDLEDVASKARVLAAAVARPMQPAPAPLVTVAVVRPLDLIAGRVDELLK